MGGVISYYDCGVTYSGTVWGAELDLAYDPGNRAGRQADPGDIPDRSCVEIDDVFDVDPYDYRNND